MSLKIADLPDITAGSRPAPLWADQVQIATVGDGDVVVLRFFSVVPEGVAEISRVVVSAAHAKRIAEILGRHIKADGPIGA